MMMTEAATTKETTMDGTTGRVANVLAKWCNVAVTEIVEARRIEEIVADSLVLMEVQLALEKEFAVSLELADVERLQTVRDLAQLIARSVDAAALPSPA
jgi:acyl carrier protein